MFLTENPDSFGVNNTTTSFTIAPDSRGVGMLALVLARLRLFAHSHTPMLGLSKRIRNERTEHPSFEGALGQ